MKIIGGSNFQTKHYDLRRSAHGDETLLGGPSNILRKLGKRLREPQAKWWF